jgi:hypothetical protein
LKDQAWRIISEWVRALSGRGLDFAVTTDEKKGEEGRIGLGKISTELNQLLN